MAGNNQYGKIQLSVRVDKKGVSSSLKAVEKDVASLASKGKQLANLGAQLRGLGEGVNRFGRRVAVAGALAKTGFLIATKQAGDFERSLASIKVNIGDRIKKDLDIAPTLTKSATTVGGAVSKINSEYKKLEATFKSIARQFPKGPLEIAGAGNQLARAGLSKNIIQGLDPKEAEKQSKLFKKKIEAGSGGILRPLVQLSVADTTGASLEEITDKAIKLLKAFDSLNNTDIRIAIESGDFEKARQLSDEMAKNVTRDFATILKASTQANVSVVSLAESLKFPGASLADVVKGDKTGKAFREVIAVTSILQERLGDASIAGTALRGMLQRLKKPPQEIAEQMYALGFSMDKMRIKSKNGSVGLLDMLKAIEAMKQQLKGGEATQGEFNDFVSGIFDNRQVSAALSLIDTSTKELERRVEDLKIQGDPEEFFNQFEKILNNNVQGALGRTISAVQNLGLAIGDALSTPAQGALDSIAKLADRISNFVENNQDLVRGLALATAGLIAIGGAITFAGAAFSTIAITVIGAGLAMELFAKKGVMLDGLRKGVVSLTSAYKGLAAAQSLSAGMIPVAPVKNLAKAAPAAAAGLTAVSKAAGGTGAAVAGGSSVLTGFAGFQKKLGKNSIPGMAAFGAGKKLRNVGKVPPVVPQAVAPKAVQQGLFAASGAASFAPKMPILGPMKQMMLDFNSLAKNRSNLPRRGGVRGASATTAALAGLTLSKADNKLFANAAKNFGKGNKNWPKVTKRLEKIGVKGARGMSFKELKDVLKNLVANTSKSGAVAPVMMGTRGSKPIGAFGGDMRRRSAAATTKFGRSATTFVPGPSKATDAFFSRQRVRDFRKNRGFLGNALLRARGAARGAGLSKANLALIGSSIASGIRGNGRGVVGSLLSGQGRGPSAFRGAGAIAGAGLASAGRGLGTAAMTATVGFKAFGDTAMLAISNVVKSVVKLAAGMVSLAGTAAVLGLSFSGALSASGEALDGLIANLARTREAFGKSFSTLGKVFASLKFDNLIPEESIGDRLSTLADTLKVGFKAIGTSVALEFGSAFLDLLTTIGKSIFMTFVNIGKNISAALFGGPGGEDSVGIVQSIENARQDAIDQLSQIANAADERIKKGLERQAQLEAKFLGVAPEEGFTNDAVADLRKEFVQKLAKGEFGDSDSEEAIQKAGQSFKKAVEDLEKKDLIDFADGLRDKLETAGEKLKTQLETIALADERGALKPGERAKFESAAKEEFKSNSPIFKAAEEHMKAAEKLKEAGKSLTAKIDPRVSLDQRVKELSDLFASGAISLGTFRQAVEDAEFEESERLTALQKERAARGRGGAGASQVGSGTFFSKFNQLLGRGGQDETTIRKKVLTAQVDFLEIAKTALKTAGENLKNSDIGTAAQTAFENVKSAFDQPLANLMQAGTDLKEAAVKLLKGPEEEVKEPPVATEESSNRSAFPSPKKFETPVPQFFKHLDDPRKQVYSHIKPAGKVFQGQIDTSIGSASGKMQLDRFKSAPEWVEKLDGIADGFMTKGLGVSSVNEPTINVNVNLDGKKLMSSFNSSTSGGYPTGMGSGRFGGFRANGGGVNRGKGYVVGERGPELFFPTESGQILSNGLSKKVDGMFATGTDGQDEILKMLEEGMSVRDVVNKQIADELKANPKSASAQLMNIGSGIADLMQGPFSAAVNTFQGPNDASKEALNIRMSANDARKGNNLKFSPSIMGGGDIAAAQQRSDAAQEQYRRLNEEYGVQGTGGFGNFDMTQLPDLILDTVAEVGLGGLATGAKAEQKRRYEGGLGDSNGVFISSGTGEERKRNQDFATSLVEDEAARKNMLPDNLLRSMGIDPNGYRPSWEDRKPSDTGPADTSTEGFEGGLDNIKALNEEFGDLRMTIDDVAKDFDGIPMGDMFPPRSAEQITMDNLTRDFDPANAGVGEMMTSIGEIQDRIVGDIDRAANVGSQLSVKPSADFGDTSEVQNRDFEAQREARRKKLAAERERLAPAREQYLMEREAGLDPRSRRRRMAQMQRSAMAAGGNMLVPDAAMNAMPNAAVDAGRVGAGAGNLQKADLEPLAKDATINELIGKVGELIGKVSTGGLME